MNNTCQVVERYITSLRPYARNARAHSKKQIKQIARSIERFGFTNPVLVSDEGEIIAGHGRVEAARLPGRKNVPTIGPCSMSGFGSMGARIRRSSSDYGDVWRPKSNEWISG
jgi:hypothetical protein